MGAEDQSGSPADKDDPRPADDHGTDDGGVGAGRDDGPDKAGDAGFQEPLSRAERSVDDQVVRALGASYGFRKLANRGATAIGDNSSAIQVSAAMPEPFTTNRVDATVLAAERARYVPTSRDGWIDRALRARHLVYLSGSPGTGRGMTARAALHRARPEAGIAEVYLRDGGTLGDLATLAEDSRQSDVEGLLIHCPVGVVDSAHLGSLARVAQSHSVYVAVVGEQDESRRDGAHYQVPHDPPAPMAVFERVLRHAARAAGAEVVIGLCVNDEVLSTRVAALRRTGEISALVERIVDQRPSTPVELRKVLRDEAPLSLRRTAHDLLTDARPSSSTEPGTRTSHPDQGLTYRRCFRLAYALMNGCRISVAADAARTLCATMQVPDPAPMDPESSHRSWDGFGLCLADLVPDTLGLTGEEVRIGSGRKCQLTDDGLLPALLDVAWNDYPDSQENLLSWLKAMVVELDDKLIRQRVSVAAAMFALFDYDRVFPLLNDWASSAFPQRRQVAGLTLALLARNSDRAATVRRLIHDWVHSRFSRLRDTALRTYVAGLTTVVSVERVVADLGVIAGHASHRNSPVIAMVADQTAQPSTMHTILSALHTWQRRGGDAAVHAVRTALRLAGERDDESERGLPVVVRWIGTDPDRRAAFVSVFGPTLAHIKTAHDGWRRVGSWLSAADGDEDGARVVLEVLRDLVSIDALRGRAEFHLRHAWRTSMPFNPLLDEVAAMVGVQA
ncbi:hypothetical protein [Actinocatenispora rupis]|uniref:Uncharacterized protein n=1 Tax=Actinocatenispora rupis TaxID=519421 RepID=A0A8J3J1T4_9ACTN|nr:hypothetical protein [Actinocatenispora rupis]GID10525.1 hypothetical protein Aru02nite_14140 [Actinocatenispora rupis]